MTQIAPTKALLSLLDKNEDTKVLVIALLAISIFSVNVPHKKFLHLGNILISIHCKYVDMNLHMLLLVLEVTDPQLPVRSIQQMRINSVQINITVEPL